MAGLNDCSLERSPEYCEEKRLIIYIMLSSIDPGCKIGRSCVGECAICWPSVAFVCGWWIAVGSQGVCLSPTLPAEGGTGSGFAFGDCEGVGQKCTVTPPMCPTLRNGLFSVFINNWFTGVFSGYFRIIMLSRNFWF